MSIKEVKQENMRFLDLFAGIGGFRLGMEKAGHECVGYVEWDKYARKSYETIHDTEGEWTWNDISTIDYRELPKADCWCFGFPCQDISIGGKQKGFKGNRSSLFFAVTKRLRQIKEWDPERMPTFLFIENVKNFLSVNRGWDFLAAQIELDEIGYNVEWELLDSKDFGIPQHRERVFIIGHLRGASGRKVFPITRQTNEYSTIGKSTKTAVARTFTAGGHSAGNHSGMTMLIVKEATKKGYDIAYPGDSINYSVPGSKTRRGRVGKEIANTLDTGCQQGVVTENCELRRLTPREAFRLQGFPDWAFEKAAEVNSDSQLYKQAGNSVTVNVIYEIAKRLGVDE
jgi:DNA (cytosine-5)-methyltransferase 1